MITLALDTSTDVRVGLARDGQTLGRATVHDRMQHVEQLTPLVRGLCADHGVSITDVDLVVCGLGPGPFTGLRVGIATARILALVANATLHGVTALDVIAHQLVAAGAPEEFLVATDARRKEVYWAHYDATGGRLSGPAVDKPVDLPALPVIGPGLTAYPELTTVVDAPVELDAGLMAVLGGSLPDAGSEPLYLRRPDATLPGAAKSVLPRIERGPSPDGGSPR